MKGLIAACMVLMASQAMAQEPLPTCTPKYADELQTELDGIDAMRRLGGLNQFRGVCTIVRSTERIANSLGGNVLSYVDAALKKIGIEYPPNLISDTCKNIHRFTDDAMVGKREAEVKAEQKRCSEK